MNLISSKNAKTLLPYIILYFVFQVLYNSLKQLLEYSEPDLEEVFMQTFRISYQDVFGSTITYDLKENGDQLGVTQDNKYVS